MLIGLCGKKRSGKSTVAKYLVKHHNFTEVTFAYPIKEIIGKQLFHLTDEQMYGDDDGPKEAIIPEWNKSPRQILQLVGTEWFRNQMHQDFWVKWTMKHVLKLNYNIRNIVISDVRFPNEINAIKAKRGSSIRVVKTGQVSTDQHASEIALDDYKADYTIEAAQGKIKSLHKQIDEIVDKLKHAV